jgi:hypothetical protein
MNFLTKLLQAIGFVPAIVSSVEGLFGKRSGQDKQDAALAFLENALSLGEAVANRQVVDEAKFKEGLSQVISGTVECLNASVWAKSVQASAAGN